MHRKTELFAVEILWKRYIRRV